MINSFKQLTKFEFKLWLLSNLFILISVIISQSSVLFLFTSLIGITALLFLAKGLPSGQVLTIIFGIFYAYISYSYRYYGEMITYLGMTVPSALFALILWVKHPFEKGKPVVEISKLTKRKMLIIVALSIMLTIIFYFLLRLLNTPNLLISTASIFTSLLASLFMIFRVPYYAIAYSLNDILLIILWVLASITSLVYLPMVVCFSIFLINDLYAYKNWILMKQQQYYKLARNNV